MAYAAGCSAIAQNATTNTGAAPVYNGSYNNGSSLNNTNRNTQPANSNRNNNVNTGYRSHYQPTQTRPGTITPQTPGITPNSAVPGAPANTTQPPIGK